MLRTNQVTVEATLILDKTMAERSEWKDSATSCEGSENGVRSRLRLSARRRRFRPDICMLSRRASTTSCRAGCSGRVSSEVTWEHLAWMRPPGLNGLKPASGRVASSAQTGTTGSSLPKMCGETGLAPNPLRDCDGWVWG